MYVSNQSRLKSYVSERRGEERVAANHQKRLDQYNAEQLGKDVQAQKLATLIGKVGERLMEQKPMPAIPLTPSQTITILVKKFLGRKPLGQFETELQTKLRSKKFKAQFHEQMSDFVQANPNATKFDQLNKALQLIGGEGRELETSAALRR